MSETRRPISIDGDLLAAAVARAEATGVDITTVIEEALRRYLDGDGALEAIWAALPEQLDEARSLELAYAELQAVREQRRTSAR